MLRYIRPKYSPITPKDIRVIPPNIRRRTTIVVKPWGAELNKKNSEI